MTQDTEPSQDELFQMLDEMAEPIVTEDWEQALAPEEGYVEYVDTGRTDPKTGRPVVLKVTLIDPNDPAILVAYLASEGSGGPGPLQLYKPKAARSLWAATIKAPHKLADEEQFEKLPSGFKVALTFKILKLLRVQDFLEVVAEATMTDIRAQKRLSIQSRTGTGKTPVLSEIGPDPTSGRPTLTPVQDAPESGPSSSTTSPSSSPTPSQKSASPTPKSEKSPESSSGPIRIGKGTARTS